MYGCRSPEIILSGRQVLAAYRRYGCACCEYHRENNGCEYNWVPPEWPGICEKFDIDPDWEDFHE